MNSEEQLIVERAIASGATNLALIARRIERHHSIVWRYVRKNIELHWQHEKNKVNKVNREIRYGIM